MRALSPATRNCTALSEMPVSVAELPQPTERDGFHLSRTEGYSHLDAAACSWLGAGSDFAEGLGGLGEGVGKGLVPVHARAAGAELPSALIAEDYRQV
jgi:hypothetical protein